MSIKISGTTVIDDSRNIQNIGVVTATSFVGSGASFTGIVTAISFVGNVTGTASTASFATTSFGLSGSPNIDVGNINSSGLTISGISTFNGNLIFNQFANEKVNIVAGTANGNTNIDLITNGSVNYFTSNSSATWTPNFRASSSVSLNSVMSIGQVITATIISTQNNSAYYASTINVDGSSRTIYWSGGSAPTAGSSSGVDMYTYSIIKTASNTFTVFGSISQYA
ncbi:MAG: hypothetical protein EBS19_04355 [Spirochaetia bacterium]|nr:hypothetical protein [Spirochaetia bacterium]